MKINRAGVKSTFHTLSDIWPPKGCFSVILSSDKLDLQVLSSSVTLQPSLLGIGERHPPFIEFYDRLWSI